MTVRELIAELSRCKNLDAEVLVYDIIESRNFAINTVNPHGETAEIEIEDDGAREVQ